MEVKVHFSDRAKADIKLVDAAKNGDQAAYSAIMLRYRESIYHLALKMVKNDGDAEDLSIETFTKAFSNLDQYSSKYAFSTWLYRIATNHCIDFIRKKKLKVRSIDQVGNDGKENYYSRSIRDSSKDPEAKFIERQKIELLREMVNKLDEPYRSLVELRYFKEYAYNEIAEAKNIPLGTVKAQLFRARALLANLIRKQNNINREID